MRSVAFLLCALVSGFLTVPEAGAGATPALAEHLQRRLGVFEDVTAGVDCPARNLLVGRLLATRGPQFADARAAMRNRDGLLQPCSASAGLRL